MIDKMKDCTENLKIDSSLDLSQLKEAVESFQQIKKNFDIGDNDSEFLEVEEKSANRVKLLEELEKEIQECRTKIQKEG